MYTMRKKLYRLFAVLATLLGAKGVEAGGEGEATDLVGDYGMTTSQSCVRTPFVPPSTQGFDDATKALFLDGESVSAIGSGIMRFKRDGTVKITDGRFTEILNDKINPGDVPVSALTEFSCAGNYLRLPDRKINVDLECTVKSPGPGVVVTIKPLNFEGYVGRARQTLQLSLIDGAIQTVAVSVNGQVVQQRERICVQDASLSRIR